MKKGNNRFKTFIIAEIIFLVIMLFVARMWILPALSGESMLHIRVATNVFMIGLCVSIFTLFATFFKREWRGNKKYIAIPAIFTVFGFLLMQFAQEVSLF